MSINLDEVIGLCRYCAKPLGNTPPPACAHCAGRETKRLSRITQPDPYKKVWNTVEDEEAALLSWVRNGTLFVPSLEELGRRHIGTAKYLLAKARKLGRSTEAIELFEEARFHQRMAQQMFDKHGENLTKSR